MGELRFGVNVGYLGMDAGSLVAAAQQAERLGFHSAWVAEAWGTDAVTPLAWIAAHTTSLKLGTAIMQMSGRTPAMTAMTAMTLDTLSGGRLILGLGVSGPQVVEGWHGQPYGKPLARTREYVAILRTIFAAEERLRFAGTHYRIPYDGADSTSLGKPLRSSAEPRPDIPIYIAAIGPKNIEQACRIADGLLPVFFSPTRWRAMCGDSLATVDPQRFDVAPAVHLVTGEDLQACRDRVKPFLALYVGGMGPPGKNFYNDLVCRYGYEADAAKIQGLYLGGHRRDAIAAVPDALVDEVALVGPPGHVADQLAMWRESPATTLLLGPSRAEDLDVIAALR